MSRGVDTGNSSSAARRVLQYSSLACLGLVACTSVLGIEELHPDPRDGAAGESGATTGGSGAAGGSTTGGANSTGGKDATAGVGASGGNSGSDSSGGRTSAAGSDAMGGSGGMVNPNDHTVHGNLIDFWGHKLPNIAIQIGDTLTTTDANGGFQVANVPATYDVSLAADLDPNANAVHVGWVFQGLTRRDPTLQIYRGLSRRSANIVVTPMGAVVGAKQQISVVVGGVDGNTDLGSVAANGVDTDTYWVGPNPAQQSTHALYFGYDASADLPTAYFSYGSTLALLMEDAKTNISVTLPKGTLSSGNLQGTAVTGGGSDRENQVFLRFTTGAALRLVDDSPGPNTFSYLVPSIPNSSITVAASEGWDTTYGPYAVAHADGLSAGSTPALKIPSVPTLISPASDVTGVNSSTKFKFQSPSSNPGPFVVSFDNVDLNGSYTTLWVVTTSKELTIPEVLGGGFKLTPNNAHVWSVETHGTFASVDEMAGPKGFIDPFGAREEPVGPATTGGFYTLAQARRFTTAP